MVYMRVYMCTEKQQNVLKDIISMVWNLCTYMYLPINVAKYFSLGVAGKLMDFFFVSI